MKPFKYKLPKVFDPEGNDDPVVYLDSVDMFNFPSFVTFQNETNTIFMEPYLPG